MMVISPGAIPAVEGFWTGIGWCVSGVVDSDDPDAVDEGCNGTDEG
jgi:hypothetical protein